MKGRNSWFSIENISWNHVNIFTHTDYLITKLDIISVANCAYRATDLIIPSSFINIRQSFKSHHNTHAQSRHIAVSSMCLQTRKRLLNLELKIDKSKYSGNTNKGW